MKYLGFLKDLLDIVWKIAPVFLVPAGLLLWSYLQSIKWTSLFHDSALSGPGLVFLVVSAIVMAFMVAFLFVLPSLPITWISELYKKETRIPPRAIRLYHFALLIWCLALIPVFWGGDRMPSWLLIPILFAAPLCYCIRYRDELGLDQDGTASRLSRIGKLLALATTAFYMTLCISLPMLFAIQVATRVPERSETTEFVAVVLCSIVPLGGTIPGLMYLAARAKKYGAASPRKIALSGALFLTSSVLLLGVLFTPLNTIFLRGAGIFRDEAATFQILQPANGLPKAFTAAGIPVHDEPGFTTVTAFVRYSFAGTKLLCKDPFDPERAKGKTVRNTSKKDLPDPSAVGGIHCVPTGPGELREMKL